LREQRHHGSEILIEHPCNFFNWASIGFDGRIDWFVGMSTSARSLSSDLVK
jgi:hypothetical protein